MVDAAGATRTTGRTITETLGHVRSLLALPWQPVAALIDDGTRALASKQAHANLSAQRLARLALHALDAWLTQATGGDEPHTRDVRLTASDLQRLTGINPRFWRAALTALAALGFKVDIGESSRLLGMTSVGNRVAAKRHGADDHDPRRPSGALRATTATADLERLATTVAKALLAASKYSVAATATCAPHEVFTREAEGRVLVDATFAAVPRGTPITRRPARARVVSRLVHRQGVAAASDLAALEGCSMQAMRNRLRLLGGLVSVADGIVLLTPDGSDVWEQAVADGRASVEARVAARDEQWREAQARAATAWLERRDHPQPAPAAVEWVPILDGKGSHTCRWRSLWTGEVRSYDDLERAV